ncbi:hypothetical protein H8E88_02555 [candidate division KSB1 bacterium]|nr:hypothetical protein [candidate division KSB1 bacterium]
MTDLTRRYTDHLEQTSDHDLLIKLHTKMDGVCKTLKEKNDSINHTIETLNTNCLHRREVCDAAMEKKLPNSTFWKLVTILVVVLGVLFTTAITNRVDVTKNTSVIIQNTKQLDKNTIALDRVRIP